MSSKPTLSLLCHRGGLLVAVSLVVAGVVFASPATAAQKRVFMAPDDHTDYFWMATDAEYEQLFITMLGYYLDRADATAGESSEYQSRFSADGSLWLRAYEKNETPGEFQRLVDRIKSGHISAPLNPLVITYGGVPAEAVLRSMYYAGQLERRYGLDFPLAIAMENAGMSYGLGSLWVGAGAKYSWKGVCNCPSLVPNLDNRDHEVYRWVGPDGGSLIMKWNSFHAYDSIGGYAEARFPDTVLDYVTTNAASNGFAARYPYNTIGVFGQGWDDLFTTNLNIQQTCKTKSDSTRACIVSNTIDFFEDFAPVYGAALPTVSASFGNEWDLSPASLAEVSARVKRSLEKLRSAEALATLVSLKNPSFLNGRDTARDRAFLDLGLYFEHDFENGGPRVGGATRIAWQRQVATEIETYANTLAADAATALGAMIQKSGANPRFFLFNPLSWIRTDIADLPYAGALPVHVVDLSNGTEVPSQVVTVSGTRYIRVQAQNIPSVGYNVFEIQPGSGQAFANPPTANAATGVLENDFYRVTVSTRGAITSLIDKRLANREFAGAISGYALNDLGAGSGTLGIENAGPVSVTLVATAAGPLAHTTRVTLTRGSDRVAIQNEVTQNFGGTRSWRFSFNLTSPDVRHEEVGAVLRARLTTDGGNYSPRNARYDFLTLNHFADMSGTGSVGVTLSNADAYFMTLGASTTTTLDTATSQLSVVLGASLRPYNPILNQAGDAYFLQRFALQSHGAFDPASAMRFSLAHQNPLTVGTVSGGTAYPETSYSYLSISDPNVLLWALKPAEEGIGDGVIARVWNLAPTSRTFALVLNETLASAKQISHIELDRSAAAIGGGTLTSSIAQNQLLSFRLFPSSLPRAVKVVASNARVLETGRTGSFTVTRTGDTSSSLNVPYVVSGTATAGSDYQSLPGSATIPSGAASVVIPIVPINDSIPEPDETITVTLTPQPTYLLGLWNSATASLLSDETPISGALYPFGEGTGGTTADASGNGNTGTLQNGVAWTTGKYGSGLNFDGVDDFVSVPDAATLDLGASGTIEAWVRLDTLNRWHSVIAKGNVNSNPAHNYALEINNSNRFLCILGNGSGSVAVSSTVTAVTGRFYHLACVWNGSSLQLYLDGAPNASVAQTVVPAGNSSALYIGQFGGNADRLDGMIDEVRIYGRALAQTEVQSDMNTPISSAPPPSDTTNPTVTLTAPASGATVSGTVTVSASASDNVGVAGVQFKLDGGNLNAEDTTAPYTMSWNTQTVANGSHTLSAVARDAASNTGTATNVPVTVSNAAPPPPTTGLVATYAFREGSGTGTADASGNGNSGTLTNGPTWTTAGKYGTGIHFDGIDDYVSVPDSASLDIGNTGTIEAWVKLDALNRWNSVIAKGNANSNPVHNYALEINNANRFQCIWGNGSSQISVISTTPATANQFIHVACVWNGTSHQLYLNGALNASTTGSLTPAANTSPLYIGQFGGNTDRLVGTIDEVRIYNTARTQTQIQSDMNTPL